MVGRESARTCERVRLCSVFSGVMRKLTEYLRVTVQPKMTGASDSAAKRPGMDSPKLAKMDKIDSNNNNDAAMKDDMTISDKELDKYLEHYNKWEQSAAGRWLQQFLADKLGIKFDNEIKWKNVGLIGGLHFFTAALFFFYVWDSTIVTWLWGEFDFETN